MLAIGTCTENFRPIKLRVTMPSSTTGIILSTFGNYVLINEARNVSSGEELNIDWSGLFADQSYMWDIYSLTTNNLPAIFSNIEFFNQSISLPDAPPTLDFDVETLPTIPTQFTNISYDNFIVSNSSIMCFIVYQTPNLNSFYSYIYTGGTWTQSTLYTTDYPMYTPTLYWTGSEFVLAFIGNAGTSQYPEIKISTDGLVWTSKSAPTLPNDSVYTIGGVVRVGSSIYVYFLNTSNYNSIYLVKFNDNNTTTIDTLNFIGNTINTNSVNILSFSISYNGSQFIFSQNIDSNMIFWYSGDGINFTASTSIAGNNFANIIWDGSTWVAAINNLITLNPQILTSTNGSTWINKGDIQNNGYGNTLSLCFVNNTYYVLSFDLRIYSSTDLTTWTRNIIPKDMYADVYVNGIFYMLTSFGSHLLFLNSLSTYYISN